MSQIHYLNVRNGDCSFIKHNDGKVSVIDVNNAFLEKRASKKGEYQTNIALKSLNELLSKANFNQKDYPVNPIEYLKSHSMNSVFRFILTHPDMDHMDGIEDFFEALSPTNFWDTANTKELVDFSSGRFQQSDWEFYKKLRAGEIKDLTRLTLYAGTKGKYYNEGETGEGGNGLHILAPTKELIAQANESEAWNDSSYVIKYLSGDKKVIFGGDADTNTWDHIIKNHKSDIENVDLLIAPHHGRKSSCSYDFLKIMKPKVTFFGNADKASQLAHNMFNSLGLYKITNNQGNCLIAEITGNDLNIYVTNKRFAEEANRNTFYNETVKGYFIKTVK